MIPSEEPAITVALGTECDDYDRDVYRALLALVLPRRVELWDARDKRFSGWKSILSLGDPFLRSAAKDGVEHALFAIDNDGGSKKRLVHADTHHASIEAADEDDGCRYCWLSNAIPRWWREGGRKQCLVVPVQALETWLLSIGGYEFGSPTPEQSYHRRALKRAFFGKPLPPVEGRREMALARLAAPEALTTLRTRPSFQLFEHELRGWA